MIRHFLAMTICAGLAFCCLAAEEHSARLASAAFDEGVKAAKEGKLDEAEACFQKAIAIYPLMPGAYMELGNLRMAKQQPEEAVKYYLQARQAWVDLHNKRLSTNVKSEAQHRENAQEVINTPDNRQINPGWGPARGIYERDKAENVVKSRDIVNPELELEIPALFYLYLGNAYLQLGKPDLAAAELMSGIARDPKSAPLHFNLAVAYLMQEQFERSADEARKARELGLALPPQFISDLESRGKLKL